jgi:hypothetical protein
MTLVVRLSALFVILCCATCQPYVRLWPDNIARFIEPRSTFFGAAVALSGDGNLAVVTARTDLNAESLLRPSAVVFGLNASGGWQQYCDLPFDDAPLFDFFGLQTAISGNGSYIVVSKYMYGATIFSRGASTWERQQVLWIDGSVHRRLFGRAVAMNQAGDMLFIGAPEDADPNTGESTGNVYVYTREGNDWTLKTRIFAPNEEVPVCFGGGLAVNGAGTTLLVGCGKLVPTANAPGPVFVYTLKNGVWSMQQQLVSPDSGHNDNFGYSMAISADAKYALVGQGGLGGNYMFEKHGNTWNFQSSLQPNDGSDDQLGEIVSLNTDGSVALVAAFGLRPVIHGVAHIFHRKVTGWVAHTILAPPDTSRLSSAVLSPNGMNALLGVHQRNAAYYYDANALPAPSVAPPAVTGEEETSGYGWTAGVVVFAVVAIAAGCVGYFVRQKRLQQGTYTRVGTTTAAAGSSSSSSTGTGSGTGRVTTAAGAGTAIAPVIESAADMHEPDDDDEGEEGGEDGEDEGGESRDGRTSPPIAIGGEEEEEEEETKRNSNASQSENHVESRDSVHVHVDAGEHEESNKVDAAGDE